MTPASKFSLVTLSEDLAEDSAAYIGVFCERASSLKFLLVALKTLSVVTLLVGGRYLADAEHWRPGAPCPLGLSIVAWALVVGCALALLRRWPARVEAYGRAAHHYTELYTTFTRLARGTHYRATVQADVFADALAKFHCQQQPVGCRPVTYRELARTRANFRQQSG